MKGALPDISKAWSTGSQGFTHRYNFVVFDMVSVQLQCVSPPIQIIGRKYVFLYATPKAAAEVSVFQAWVTLIHRKVSF